MRNMTGKTLMAIALSVATLMAATSCTSEKSTSKQTSYRKVDATTKATTTTKTSSTSTSSTSKGKSTTAKKTSGKVEKGQASYYADKFHGRSTASGEKYDKKKLTGAHRTLPFGTIVRVTNTANGKSVDIRINDRGPFKAGRVVDLSRAAAEKVDMIQSGVINCTVEVISQP
ncbi:MAG: septal ring lytic transglycosylase RlpA family protein [Bacteroidales bacterium]|nr:septal ring lytic transglycosylase RlpA family protein [Bacteroidales bacterium]